MAATELRDVTYMFTQLQLELEEGGIRKFKTFDEYLRHVVSDFKHYFKDISSLSNIIGLGTLAYEHAFIKRTETWSKPYLIGFLNEYESAKSRSKEQVLEYLSYFAADIDIAFRHVSHISQLHNEMLKIEDDIWIRSCFRDLADLIEVAILPFAKLRLKLISIIDPKKRIPVDIGSQEAGNIFAILSDIDSELYKPHPFNISLSQWRNIAHHSSYIIKDNNITCNYGKKDNLKSLTCTREELLKVSVHANKVFYLHRAAYEIFGIDNYKLITPKLNEKNILIEYTDMSYWATIVLGIVASGFKIKKAAYKDFRWAFVLSDVLKRSKVKANADLQRAFVPYLLISRKSPQIYAFVESGNKNFYLSFNCLLVPEEKITKDTQGLKIGSGFLPRS
jgi:hypothetical protein